MNLKKTLALGMVLALALAMLVPAAALAGTTTTVTADVGPPPTVSTVTPDAGDAPSGPTAITITGTGFVFGQPATVIVSDSGVTVGTVAVDSATQITTAFTVAADAVAGPRDVTVSQLGQNGTKTGGFTVNPFITVNALASVDLGYLTAGATKTGSTVMSGLITTNAAAWTVTVHDGANGGFLKNGPTPLGTSKFQINKVAGPYFDAETGFSYTQADPKAPTLYYSQDVPVSPTAGTYSIVLTFVGSLP
jgi:hypothetical protein